MFSLQDQISTATKANFEAQTALFSVLANHAFEGVEKLIHLNLAAAKATVEDSNSAAKRLLSAKDAQELISLSAAQAQPNAEKALAYTRNLASIASTTQAEFTKAAEGQIVETSRKITTLVDDLSKNAPAGSENVVAMVKSFIGNVNAGYEQLSKTAKQAVDAVENNLAVATNQFAQAAEKASSRSKK